MRIPDIRNILGNGGNSSINQILVSRLILVIGPYFDNPLEWVFFSDMQMSLRIAYDHSDGEGNLFWRSIMDLNFK